MYFIYLQRHHFELPLLDENFTIPTRPYLVIQHNTDVQKLQRDSDNFNKLMEEFVKGKAHNGQTFEQQPSPLKMNSHAGHVDKALAGMTDIYQLLDAHSSATPITSCLTRD